MVVEPIDDNKGADDTVIPPAGNEADDKNIPPAGDDTVPPVDDKGKANDDPPPGESDDDDKGGDDDKGEDGAPESYADFTMPEGVEPNQPLVDKYVPIFKELGLSQERAQELIDVYSKQGVADAEAANTAAVEAIEQAKADTVKTLTEDPGFSGTDGKGYEEAVGIANIAIKAHGDTPEFKALLETGMQNNEAFIRFTHSIGKMMKEDKYIPGGGDGGGGGGEKPVATRMYPGLEGNKIPE